MPNYPRRPWHAAAQLGASTVAPPQHWRSQPAMEKALLGATVSGALKILRLPVSVFDTQCGLLSPASRVDHRLYSSLCMPGLG
jgi:hypothetical protein